MTRIALVTGANKGIGFETARRLGELGHTVVLGARDAGRGAEAQQQLRGQGIAAHHVVLDVADDASVEAAAAWLDAEFGHLDVLVNNAGIPTAVGRRSTPSSTSLADMHAVYETNVFGVVRVTNAMLPLLRRGSHARIVNVSSEVGSISQVASAASPLAAMPPSAQYPSSKAAVNMLTAQYAKELTADKILVNAANPGFTDTDFTQHRGIRTVQQGAEPSVHLATLDDDGPTGILWGHLWLADGEGPAGDGDGGYGQLPW